MKRQATALIINKQSERPLVLSAGLVLIAISLSNTGLMAGAQSLNQDLPPEVMPVNTAIKYTEATTTSGVSSDQVPGIVLGAQPAAQSAVQSAQEARQSLFNSLMGTNIYPQFADQASFNQSSNQSGNMAGGQNLGQNVPQTLSNDPASQSNSLGQSNLITPNQFNNTNQYSNSANAMPGQTQTLSGSSNTPLTSQPRTSGGIGKLGGLVAGVGLSAMSLVNSGPGNYYSAAQLGGSMVNYGFRNGFNF